MSKKQTTLDTFLKQQKLNACLVCKLPPQVRKQIVGRQPEVNLLSVSVWLKTIGHRITERQLAGHYRAGHERGRQSP